MHRTSFALLATLAASSLLSVDAPAQCPTDDAWEDNDLCSSAVLLAPGTYTGLRTDPGDHDYYYVQLAHGYEVVVDQTDSGAFAGLRLGALSDCMGGTDAQESLGGAGGVRTLTYGNTTGSTISVGIWSGAWSSNTCETYDLTVSVVPGDCAQAQDDVHEPNDSCGSAVPIGPGAYPNLFTDVVRQDYFAITVPPFETLVLDTTRASGEPLVSVLYGDASCSTTIGESYNDGGSIRYFNADGAAKTVYVRCGVFAQGCTLYDLSVAFVPDLCDGSEADDLAEPNNTCSQATPLHLGLETGMFVRRGDPDVYEVTLQDGDVFLFTLTENSAFGHVRYYLYDDPAWCGSLTNGVVLSGSSQEPLYIAPHHQSAFGLVPHSGPATTYYLMVRVEDDSPQSCVAYDLFSSDTAGAYDRTLCHGDGTAGPRGAHDTACPCGNASAPGAREGCVNSQGHGAKMVMQHDYGLASNPPEVLRFQLRQGRPSAPAMLLQGSDPIALPFRDGILCVGGQTDRLKVLVLDAAGAVDVPETAIDGWGAVPGETLYFQFWYRDPALSTCGTGSNFSNALSAEIV